MGFFDSITDIFTGQSAKDAAAKNSALLQGNLASGTNTLQTGQTNSLAALDSAKGVYQPLASKYGAATTLGLDALGVNGAAGNTRAVDAFHAGPGYQYAVDQSLDQTRRAAARDQSLAGGNTLAALSDRAGNMADQEYGNWVNSLNGYVSPELAATSGIANADAAKAGVYTNTANSIANLGTNTTNGLANQNTQEANAIAQGSGNLWKLGLQGATALASGGTSLLGGLGSFGAGSGTLTGADAALNKQLFPGYGTG